MKEEGMAKRKREIVEYASEGSSAIVRLAVGSRKLKADLDYHEGSWCSYVDVNDALSELLLAESQQALAEALCKTFKCWDVDDDGSMGAAEQTDEIKAEIEKLIEAVRKCKDVKSVKYLEASSIEDGRFYAIECDFQKGRGGYYQLPDEFVDCETIHLVDRDSEYDKTFSGDAEIEEAFPEFFEIREDFFAMPGEGIDEVFGAAAWPGQ